MDPRAHRTPSPGHPLQQGYQLDDNPYNHHHPSSVTIPPAGTYTPDPIHMQTAVGALANRWRLKAC